MASYQKLLEELLKSEEMDDPNNLVVCEMQSEDMRSEVERNHSASAASLPMPQSLHL